MLHLWKKVKSWRLKFAQKAAENVEMAGSFDSFVGRIGFWRVLAD
jgi:hypothetical protein